MEDAFGIYVHWPFCRSKCPYCDFNSHVRERIDEPRWAEALASEIAHFAGIAPGRTVTSVFFGGGTPSLMSPASLAHVIGAIKECWRVAEDAEITLEANPTSVEADRFRAFKECGVNRLSLGVQSLDDAALRFLGRRHDAQEALAAIATARDVFVRVSFDLIYARPGQDLPAWRGELDEALRHAADHISLYQLTIEPGTQFEQAVARGDFEMPGEAETAMLYEATVERLAHAGLADYEISNFAKPGAESRHNLVYWRYEDYVGVGPGAHGRLTLKGAKHAFRQHRAPEKWLELVTAQGHATRQQSPIPARAALDEMLMMGLRLREGVDRRRIVRVTGRDIGDWIGPERVGPLVEGGFLTQDDARIRASEAGRRVLDSLLARLLA